jgi:hypothetical protein
MATGGGNGALVPDVLRGIVASPWHTRLTCPEFTIISHLHRARLSMSPALAGIAWSRTMQTFTSKLGLAELARRTR